MVAARRDGSTIGYLARMSDLREGGKTMTRKGGGRESGDPDRGTLCTRQESSVAAANPAARRLLQCPVGLDEAYHSCCQQIRALEAELAVYREPVPGLEKTWRSRAEKAEADNQRLRELLELSRFNVNRAEAALAECKEANWSLAREE
jgi:hypothetical protein